MPVLYDAREIIAGALYAVAACCIFQGWLQYYLPSHLLLYKVTLPLTPIYRWVMPRPLHLDGPMTALTNGLQEKDGM